jgi:HEAT repeat protein
MSEVNWRLLNRRRDHTFAAPVPELTAQFGIPNACTTCHENRTPEWAATVMDGWYADGARRRRAVSMTQTMYAASAGDRGALDRLGDLAVDDGYGALIRASAAGYIGRLASPSSPAPAATLQALVRASRDPEALVRVAAVRALGAAGGDAAVPPLAERLTDAARVVRVSAAESLLYLGVTSGLGGALTIAQDEYAASLREFPDVSANHTSLGWLLAARGRTDEAVGELRLAQSLDPDDARPRVYLGVLAARAGRFGDAIDEWRAARRLNPAYPNLDALIAEAERRR